MAISAAMTQVVEVDMEEVEEAPPAAAEAPEVVPAAHTPRQRTRILQFHRINQILKRERHRTEANLIARQQHSLRDHGRLAGSNQFGSITRSAIRQHERAVVFQPDFGMHTADRIVGDGDVALAPAADGESAWHW